MTNSFRIRSLEHLLAIVCILCTAGFLVTQTAACAHSQRTDAVKAGLISVNSAREAFAIWDLNHQQQLVEAADSRDAAEKSVAEYRAKRQRIVETFETAYRGLADAAINDNESTTTVALTLVSVLLDTIKTFTEAK